LEALNLRKEEAYLKNLSEQKNKLSRIIVVHNFKNTTSENEFKVLRKKYVEDCYRGTLNKIYLEDQTYVETFEVEGGKMTHLFLAKESTIKEKSIAGDLINNNTYKYLRSLLNSLAIDKRDSFTTILSDTVKDVLFPYFADPISEVAYYANKDGEINLRASTKNNEMLKLLRNEIEYDGLYLSLAAPATFQPHIDIVKGNTAMIVVVDLPSFIGAGSKEYLMYPSKVKIDVDEDSHSLVIEGERKLYFQTYNQSTSDGSVLSKECRVYNKESKETKENEELQVMLLERKEGSFHRIVKIPKGYSKRKQDFKVELSNGRLQILIPKIQVTPSSGIEF